MTTVCILAAGLGERMGDLSYANKALVPFNNKALISNIIEIFPRKTKFVIALGYQSNQLKSYIKIAHSNLIESIKFVKVIKYKGLGSGPGHSLICCKKFLNKPFIFIACDTLLKNKINFDEKKNWVGTFRVDDKISKDYCNFEIKKNKVSKIIEKEKYENKNQTSFIGICKIHDYRIFWDNLILRSKKKLSPQISDGFHKLIEKNKLFSKKIDWLDFGTYEKYKDMVAKYSKYDFSKTDEFIFMINRKVIKFFKDKIITEQRVIKSDLNKNVLPKCKKIGSFYSYKFIKGNTLYKKNNKKIFGELLKFLEKKLWIKKSINKEKFINSCRNFYETKTFSRINLFKKKNKFFKIRTVNKQKVLSFDSLKAKIFSDNLFQGTPCFIHGDLQFDNIIYQNNKFSLIDWRHSFDKIVSCGDLYYDLAKLYGGIILNYDEIKKNKFKFKIKNNHVLISFNKDSFKLKSIYEKYLISKNLDLKKIKILTGLIYLNMSPLHKHPFDKFLYSLGILLLNKEVYND